MHNISKTGSQLLAFLLIGSAITFPSCENKEKKPDADKGYVIPDTVMKEPEDRYRWNIPAG